jgi:hypothetical protein
MQRPEVIFNIILTYGFLFSLGRVMEKLVLTPGILSTFISPP